MSSPFTFLRDLTLPLVAYLTGRAFNDIMLNAFRDARIEDLRVPFFCCSVDVNSFKLMVHRAGKTVFPCRERMLMSTAPSRATASTERAASDAGDVWRYVRASCSLGGYLPPICDKRAGEDRLYCLVDGAPLTDVHARWGFPAIACVEDEHLRTLTGAFCASQVAT